MPTCGRCARRNKQDQCVYHPAPLTRTRSAATPRLSGSEPVLSPPQTASPEAASPRTAQLDSRTTPLPAVDDDANETELQCIASSDVRHHAGFLGSTSYSAVLTENEGSLGLGQDETACHSGANPRISPEHVQKGVEILSLLKDIPIFERYIQRWYTVTQGLITIEPIIKQWMASLWSEYAEVLQDQNLEQLKRLSEHVWLNTDQKLRSESVKTSREWIELSTAKNIRWEVVGIILCLVGVVATTMPEWDPLLAFNRRYKSKRSLIVAMYRASDTCLKFCEETCIPNDIGMWLMEDILELSMGAQVSNIVERAREIQRKAEQTWDALPAYLRQEPEHIWNNQKPPIECLYLVFIHIEHLYNEFLLQRALIKRAGADTRDLLQVAVRLLADIITVAGKREVLGEFQDAYLMGRKFIKRILDKILSPESRSDVHMADNGSSSVNVDFSIPFSGNDAEFMPWLESVDWDSQSWTMFS
ncbi:putative c6 transcription [Diplodia seriata]|uniref:Putative c6 transcription n=1 Tax=Diplodia seriata TaxID=420778 RepID=A0A0G2EB94_9PEZI|nr:putative c6 transcription [Diplodia seriata]